jgi:Formyl transferase
MAKARVAVLISGRGSNMAALVYAAKAQDCPFEIVLVAGNNPDAAGLMLAEAEGILTFAQNHKGMPRAAFDAIIDTEIRKANANYIALAGCFRPNLLRNGRGECSTSIRHCSRNIKASIRMNARWPMVRPPLAVQSIL